MNLKEVKLHIVGHRDPNTTTEEYVRHGKELFKNMYGDSGDFVQGLLDNIYPDMGMYLSKST